MPGSSIVQLPPSIVPLFFNFQWQHVFTLNMIIILFTFLFVDMFDTVGTLVGVASKANMPDKEGKLPGINKLPRGRAIEVLKGVCFANIVVSDPEGRGIKPHYE